MKATKDIKDFQFNISKDSEFREHLQNSLDTVGEVIEVMETNVLLQIVKGELMATLQSSEDLLTDVVSVAPEPIFVGNKVKIKTTGDGKGWTSEYSDSSQNLQRGEAGVALQQPTEQPASSDIRVQQLNFSKSSEEVLKSWTTRGNHRKNSMRNRNGDRHEGNIDYGSEYSKELPDSWKDDTTHRTKFMQNQLQHKVAGHQDTQVTCEGDSSESSRELSNCIGSNV